MRNPFHTFLAIMALFLTGTSHADSPDPGYQFVVQFEFDSAVIDREKYERDIAELSQIMKAHDWLNVLVLGYADSSGQEHHNDHLSQRRAQAVVDKLVADHGISRNRFDAVGLGISNPVASNETREGRVQNRRSTAVISLPGL